MEEVNTEVGNTPADNALEGSVGKYASAVIIGVGEDGSIDISSNLTSYELIQYLFSRASFETFVHQRNSEQQKETT